jgi:hypothetical protein
MQALITAFGNIKDQKQIDNMAQTLYSSGILKTSER